MFNDFSEVVLLTNSIYSYDIREWIEYYQKLGFDHISIYDNSTINLKNIVKKYNNVSYTKVRGFPAQCTIELKHYKQSKYKWVFFADDDEFIWIDPKYENINTYLSLKEKELNADIIAVYWVKISSNPCMEHRPNNRNTTQIKSFKYVQSNNIEQDSWAKCFYKTGCSIDKMECHYSLPFKNIKNTNNQLLILPDIRKRNYNYRNDDILIYHYFHRSWDEFNKKINSSIATTNILYKKKFSFYNINTYYNYIKLLYNIGYTEYVDKIEKFMYG